MSEKYLIILPHIKIHNANALSSPFTIGFPAMTAWLGFTHALERKFNQAGYEELRFLSTAVVSHDFNLQTYKGAGDYVHSIIGTGNPLDKDGKRSAFIEEARCHLEVTLVVEIEGNEDEIWDDDPEGFNLLLQKYLHTMKIAGGNICGFDKPVLSIVDDSDENKMRKLTGALMPGYVLVERRELMEQGMATGDDALDTMLGFLTINHQSDLDESNEVVWSSKRKTAGWIVPIATGFHGITELGKATNQRDPEVEHRFAESLVTLGEFVMAHRITELDDMLWHYHTDLENNLYICQQNNRIHD